jgi:hypothetical protein
LILPEMSAEYVFAFCATASCIYLFARAPF